MQRRPHLYTRETGPWAKQHQVIYALSRPIQDHSADVSYSPLTICTRVGNSIHLLDPSTLQSAEITSPIYWRAPFDSLATVSELVEFTVLDIEPSGVTRGKYVLADAQVAPARAFRSGLATAQPSKRRRNRHADEMDVDGDGDMEIDENIAGGTDAIYHTRTHLGGVLQPGDTVLGYYLSRANFNSDAFAALDSGRIPDVILIKKTFPNRRRKPRHRNWKLRSIAKEAEDVAGEENDREESKKKKSSAAGRGALGRRGGLDSARVEADYEHFLRDLEEDPELRATVNLYRADLDLPDAGPAVAPAKKAVKVKGPTAINTDATAPEGEDEAEVDAEEDFPDIRVDELLDHLEELTISDPPVAPQEE